MREMTLLRSACQWILGTLVFAAVVSQIFGGFFLLASDRLHVAIDDNRSDIIERRHDDSDQPGVQTNPNQGTPPSISRHAVVSVAETLGELEVAASREGKKAVVAVNNLVGHAPFSQNTIFYLTAAGTFAPSNLDSAIQNIRDPTVTRGGNNRFYYAALVGSNVNVGVSDNGGQDFSLVGPNAHKCKKGAVSTTPPCPPVAQCFPNKKAKSCKSDQPHIAADPRGSGPADKDQLYIVWRETDSFGGLRGDVETQMIQCSADGGTNWKKPVAVGRGMFARVFVDGTNGSVYVVFADQRTGTGKIFLQKFSTCSDGLVPSYSESPGRFVTQFNNVPCPIPGLDRCNDGNILASPTVTADGPNVFVTYADNTGPDNEAIRVAVSEDGGATFPSSKRQTMSPQNGSGRRFMPWSCASGGQVFVGWFDRSTATASMPDLTTYHLRSLYMPHLVNGSPPPQLSNDLDLSGGVEDRQCSMWPRSPRNSADSTSCNPSNPPSAGVCAPASPKHCGRQKNCSGTAICADGFCLQPGQLTLLGHAARCNFSSNNCGDRLSCATGRGGPKYGDYNGFACAGNHAFIAWPSTIPPAGAQHPIGSAADPRLTVYFATVDAAPPTPGAVPTNPPPSPPPTDSSAGGICNLDSDCHGVNEHCLNGICKPRGPQCTTNAQCPSGTACVNHNCSPI